MEGYIMDGKFTLAGGRCAPRTPSIIAWTGGSDPSKPSETTREEWRIVSALFKEQMADWNLFWGDWPHKDTRRIFYNRARGDAHATIREISKKEG